MKIRNRLSMKAVLSPVKQCNGFKLVNMKTNVSRMRTLLGICPYGFTTNKTIAFMLQLYSVRHSYKKNQLQLLIPQIYFWNKTPNVSDSSPVHHQEFFTVHTAMVYVIQFADSLRANLYDIYHCCVYSEKLLMMDRGTVRNM